MNHHLPLVHPFSPSSTHVLDAYLGDQDIGLPFIAIGRSLILTGLDKRVDELGTADDAQRSRGDERRWSGKL